MANIFDYLTWRADVPFSVDPFNLVDNLVLSELAYTDFDGIVGKDPVSLQDACRLFFEMHSREEISSRTSYTARSPFLMDAMAAGARFADLMISHYVQNTSMEQELQFAAMKFSLPDGSDYIAFRGTDGTIVGWKEDFNLCYMRETEGQKRAAAYLNEAAGAGETIDTTNVRPLRVGGHSKGGNLAVYAAAFCQEDVQRRIDQVYSNDGPGFLEEITRRTGYQRILPRILSIVPESSVFGVLLSGPAERIVVDSSARGFVQHDGNSWLIERNHFIPAVQTETSRYMETVFSTWLAGMDEKERITFVETIFSVLESTGAETFREVAESKRRSFEAIYQAMRCLPKEQQQDFFRIMGELLQTGGSTFWGRLRGET